MSETPRTDAKIWRGAIGTTGDNCAHYAVVDADFARELERELKEARAQLAGFKNSYYELIFAVGNKYEGETRHQTALRYIKQAQSSTTLGQCMQEPQT